MLPWCYSVTQSIRWWEPLRLKVWASSCFCPWRTEFSLQLGVCSKGTSTLEALLSPLHRITSLLIKPPESICCSKRWWFQDAGYPPHPEPHQVWGSSLWCQPQLVLCCANWSWGAYGRSLHFLPRILVSKNNSLASWVLWGILQQIFKTVVTNRNYFIFV